MRRFGWSALLVSITALGPGCHQESRGPQVTLQGQMLSQTVLTPPPSLRLAIGWYPSWFSETPGAPLKTVLTQSATYQGNFPLDFTFTLDGPPPPEALVAMVPPGGDPGAATGVGKIAYGVLIAYQDGNGNGTLDLATATTPSPDRIAGISMPDPSGSPPPHTYFVVYLDGRLDKADYFGAFDLQQGYNLLQLHSDYGIQLVPSDTSISLQITDSDALGIYACSDTDWAQMTTACGINPYNGGYRLRGNVYGSRTTNQVWVQDGNGVRTDGALTFNGQAIPVDGPTQTYLLPSIPAGANTFQLSLPGYAPETINFTMPGAVVLTSSVPTSIPSGSTLTLSWERDPAVELYDLYISTNADYAWLDHVLTTDTTYVTQPLVGSGAAHIYLQGLAPLAVGNNGSYVTPVNTVRVDFTLTP